MIDAIDSKMKSVVRWIRNNETAAVFIAVSPIVAAMCWSMLFASETIVLNINQNINGDNSSSAVSGIGDAYAGSQVVSGGGIGHGKW